MSSQQHLLVDGANILHAWPELRVLAKNDRDAARSKLVQQLIALHDGEQFRVTVVFDGHGSELVVERPLGEATFSVLYTPSSLTGDDVIEQLVAKAADPSVCIVATADHAERQTVEASGGQVISPEELAARTQRATERQSARVTELRRSTIKEWRKS